MPEALYNYCVEVYSEMEKVATSPEGYLAREYPPETKIYSGALTKLFGELGIAMPHYTSVLRKLRAMGCMDQIQRGGGPGGQSKWILFYKPSKNLYSEAKDKPSSTASKKEILEQQLRDMRNAIISLQADFEFKSNEADMRLKMIESQLMALAKEVEALNARHNS